MSRLSSCRICGASEAGLQSVLDLGATPLANRLLRAEQLDQEEPRYPLELVLCPRCSLLQLTETVPPEILFREYLYCSSFSDTMLRHAQELAERLIVERETRPVELGDGGCQQRRLSLAILRSPQRPGLRHRAGSEHRAGRARARHPHHR